MAKQQANRDGTETVPMFTPAEVSAIILMCSYMEEIAHRAIAKANEARTDGAEQWADSVVQYNEHAIAAYRLMRSNLARLTKKGK